MKHYGIDLNKELREQSKEDRLFSSISDKCLADISENIREQYLPKGERQDIGEEKMDCASRGPTNIFECKFTYLWQTGKLQHRDWLLETGYVVDNKIIFSDAFVAINSGTTRNGNSLKAPCHAIHKQGLIPKAMLPQVASFDEYHNPKRITRKMRKLGKEFIQRFPIKYEKVYGVDYENLLRKDLLDVAAFSWPSPINGEYPRVNYSPNHCFILFKRPMSFAFDNYPDTYDGDFIKKLAPDYQFFRYGYRLYISLENTKSLQLSLMQRILQKMRQAIGYMFQLLEIKKNSMPKPELPPEPIPEPIPEPPKYEWNTKAKARHSVRVICDEEDLTWNEKQLISRVINCESGYNIKAIHKNKDGTEDLGIIQANTYWYIDKLKLLTREQALNDPEFCVRLMIKRYGQGCLNNWICFKNNLYKRYTA